MNRVIGESGNRVIGLAHWSIGLHGCLRSIRQSNRPMNQSNQSNQSNYSITRLPNYQILEAGFTLIELMVVISLIVILSSMGLTQYRQSVIHAKEAVLKDD